MATKRFANVIGLAAKPSASLFCIRKTEKQLRTYFRWIGAAASTLAFMWAFKVTDGNTLESISVAFKVMLAFYAIDMCLKYRNKMKESGLSKDQFLLQQAGSTDKLLWQGRNIRFLASVFAAIPLGVYLIGLGISNDVCLVIGGIMCVFFLPCAAWLFWEARKVTRVAEQAGKSHPESPDKQIGTL
jgi:hypothetical protein